MHRLSQAPPGQQLRRCRTRRPFQVVGSDLHSPRFSTLAAAQLRAQDLADRTGADAQIYDHDQGWLKPVIQPRQYRCQACRRPVTAAEWPEVWRHHCQDCRSSRDTTTMPRRKAKVHTIPDCGFHRCLAQYDGSQSRCGAIYHALEVDPAGAPPCGHAVRAHGAEEVSLLQLGIAVRVSDLQRCRQALQAWVLSAPRGKLLEPRMTYSRLLATQPEPTNPLQAHWAMLWHANNVEAARWLRRLIEERLAAEGVEVAA